MGEIRSEGRAAVWEEPIGPAGVHIRERPRTEPEDGWATVAIRRAALNHLDLWLAHGAQRVEPPRVIGADGAGVIETSRADGWSAGDEVVIYPVFSCGECAACQAHQEVLCRSFGIVGENTDGAACELIHVPARMLRRRPAGLSWDESAAFPLTFLTAWRMLTTKAQLQAGQKVLVVGAGAGVAAAAIAIARHLGATVYATSRSETKRNRALELGAAAVFESSEFSKPVREASQGGVDVVFEHVGPATFDESLRSLRPGGRVVFCGSTSGVKMELNMPRVFLRNVELLGSTMGTSTEFDALLQAVDGGLRPTVDSVYPLDSVTAALEHLDRAEHFGKVVLEVS
ncbi:MAG TPA: zinc-binding dehydrogenase [Candidatus Dormibacteraeota bacterium]